MNTKIKTILLFALFPIFCHSQVINEAQIRQEITTKLANNNTKSISAAVHRALMLKVIDFVANGGNGVAADTTATPGHVPYFKTTTGNIANSPMYINSSKVGIGTTTPANNLQIATADSVWQLGLSSPTTLLRFSSYFIPGSPFGQPIPYPAATIQAMAPNSIFYRSLAIDALNISFRTQGAERMHLYGSNLGIGVQIPNERLHVKGNIYAEGNSFHADGNVSVANTAPLNYRTLQLNRNLSGYSALNMFNNAPLAFATNNTIRAVLDSIGRFGIRRNSPLYTLDINGTARIDSSGFWASQINTGVVIGAAPYSGYKLDVAGWTRINSNTFVATESGSLGVGTVEPLAKLHIVGTSLLDGATTVSSYLNLPVVGSGAVIARGATFQSNEYVMGYGTEGVAGSNILGPVFSKVDYSPYSYRWGKHTGVGLLSDGSNFTTQMVLANNGNLGINVANPSFKLEVSGTVGIRDGLGIQIFRDGSSSVSNQLYFANTANNRAYNWQLNADGTAADFYGYTGSTWAKIMTANSSGNVGIGVDTPTSRIDVDGVDGYNQIRARKSATPSSTAASDGQTGNIVWDNNYIYIKTSAGWKRAALSTF